MADAKIRAALRAASKAILTLPDDAPDHVILAGAVSAFLRALPGDLAFPFWDKSGDTYVYDYQLQLFAEAVERAAKDA